MANLKFVLLLIFLCLLVAFTYTVGLAFIDASIISGHGIESNLWFLYFVSILYSFILSRTKKRIFVTFYISILILLQFVSMEFPSYNFRFSETYVLTYLPYFLSVVILYIMCASFCLKKSLTFRMVFEISNVLVIALLFANFVVGVCRNG